MARPKKNGLDYFPLDTNIDQDDKVIIIIAKYGYEGFGILIKLLMEIYKNGYFYEWTEKEQIIFSSRVNVNINLVKELVNDCIKWGLFNKEKYEENHVLTSKGIQERYLLATSRRVSEGIKESLSLVSVDINSSSDEKPLEESTQKKRKEIKVKEIKENKIKYLDTVCLTQTEYDKLINDFGKQLTDDFIERLDEWQTNNPKKHKLDHNKTIRNWIKKDQSQKTHSKKDVDWENI